MISLQSQFYSILDTISELSEAAQVSGDSDTVNKYEKAADKLEELISELGFPPHKED
jgi:hypothetical protein